MTDYAELRRLAEAVIEHDGPSWTIYAENGKPNPSVVYLAALDPNRITDLVDDLEHAKLYGEQEHKKYLTEEANAAYWSKRYHDERKANAGLAYANNRLAILLALQQREMASTATHAAQPTTQTHGD